MQILLMRISQVQVEYFTEEQLISESPILYMSSPDETSSMTVVLKSSNRFRRCAYPCLSIFSLFLKLISDYGDTWEYEN